MTNTECEYCSYPATFVVSRQYWTDRFACYRCASLDCVACETADDPVTLTFV